MFKSFFETLKLIFTGGVRETFEEMVLQDTIEKNKPQIEEAKPTTLVLDKPVEAKPEKVEPQIADAVTVKPKRARGPRGRLKADDKSTPGVNEAWEGGKAPVKKPRAKKNK